MSENSEKTKLIGEPRVEIDRILYQAIIDALAQAEGAPPTAKSVESLIAEKLNIQPLLVRRVRETEAARKRRLDQEK